MGAQHEDNYAANALIYDYIPRDADMDVVVAELDKKAESQGKHAIKILRELSKNGRSHGGR